MRKFRLAALALLISASPAATSIVSDPEGDFLPSFTGTPVPDLDVTSFSVDFSGTDFLLQAAFAGAIDTSTDGFFVIGVNTGAGAFDPFNDIGNGDVTFDQVIVVQETGATNLSGITAAILGDMFSLSVPLSLLPSTGAPPGEYGFNIWPREGVGVTGNAQISDFAPDNALLQSVPEPGTWLTMLLGFGLAGAALRFRRAERRRLAA
jgi:hypothetical protein